MKTENRNWVISIKQPWKNEPRRNIFRATPLSLSDNRLCLKFLLIAQQSLTVYFYGSLCVTHTLLLCVCVCVCVCVRVRDKHLHTVPYKRGCKNSWIACSFKVLSCFLKPKLFNVFIDFKSFNFFWWISPSTWRFTSASPSWWEQDTIQWKHYNRILPVNFVLQIQDIILPNPSWIDFYR